MAVFGIWQKDELTPNPGSARLPEGVQSFLGRPGERLGGEVRHVVAKRLVDLTHLLGNLNTVSRDFH